MSPILKMSNAGGMKSLARYHDMLAGNPAFVASSMESIETASVGAGGQSSINFGVGGTIPQTYKHLQISATYLTSADVGLLRFNGTTGSSTAYDFHGIRANGSVTPTAYGVNGVAHIQIGTGLGSSATIYGLTVDILDYASSSKNKVVRFTYGYDENGSGQVEFCSGLWRSTAPITSLSFVWNSGVVSQNSNFALYGIKG